jgi:hypothetical protein
MEFPKEPLKNYLRCHRGVKNRLKMLIYSSKLRFLACFCLALAASQTFSSGSLKSFFQEKSISLRKRVKCFGALQTAVALC